MSRSQISNILAVIGATARIIDASTPRVVRIDTVYSREPARFEIAFDKECSWNEQRQMEGQLDMLKATLDAKLLRLETKRLITWTERCNLQRALRNIETDVKTRNQFAQSCVMLDAFESQVEDIAKM